MRWTPDQRANAIGLALSIGADKAAAQTDIPRRTISSWLSGERTAPELEAAISRSRDDVAARLWEAVTVGTEQVLAGLRDPKARLGDKANALRIVAEQYALLTGGVTERTENVNVNVDTPSALAGPEVRAYLTQFLAAIENASDDELAENEAKVLQVLGISRNVLLYEPGKAGRTPMPDWWRMRRQGSDTAGFWIDPAQPVGRDLSLFGIRSATRPTCPRTR